MTTALLFDTEEKDEKYEPKEEYPNSTGLHRYVIALPIKQCGRINHIGGIYASTPQSAVSKYIFRERRIRGKQITDEEKHCTITRIKKNILLEECAMEITDLNDPKSITEFLAGRYDQRPQQFIPQAISLLDAFKSSEAIYRNNNQNPKEFMPQPISLSEAFKSYTHI